LEKEKGNAKGDKGGERTAPERKGKGAPSSSMFSQNHPRRDRKRGKKEQGGVKRLFSFDAKEDGSFASVREAKKKKK